MNQEPTPLTSPRVATALEALATAPVDELRRQAVEKQHELRILKAVIRELSRRPDRDALSVVGAD